MFTKNKAMVGVVALMAAFMTFIVWTNYTSQVELRKASLNQFREYSAREAATFSHFFSERQDDLYDLSTSRELLAYFENKALGMSFEYGLMASLVEISELFNNAIDRKKIKGKPLYSRIAFIDESGDILADNKAPFAPKEECDIIIPSALEPGNIHILFDAKKDAVNLIMMLPYTFKGETVGTLLVWLNAKEVLPLLAESVSNSGMHGFNFFVHGQTTYSPLHPVPWQLTSDIASGWNPRSGVIMEKQLTFHKGQSPQNALVVRSFIEGAPLYLLSVTQEEGVVGTIPPQRLLLYTLLLATLLLGGGLITLKTSAKNLILNAHIEEADRQSQKIEFKNRQLKEEIHARGKAEEALRSINDELELRVQKRTTDLKKRKDALTREVQERRDAEATVRLIFNNTHDAIFIHSTEGVIIDVNETMLELYQLKKEDALGLSILDDLSGPNMKGDILYDKWNRTRQGEKVLFDWVAKRPSDGKLFDVAIALTKIELGGQTVILANVHDISEQKKIQTQQTEHQEFLTTIFEGIGAAIFVFDPERGIMVDCNSVGEKLLGITSKEIISASCQTKYSFTSDEEKDLLCPDWHEQGTYEEGILSLQDASPIPISRQLFEVHIGGKTHLVQVVFDVAERKNLERKLSVAQKLESVGLLASGIAHEINTPIQYVGDSIRFVKESFTDTMELIDLYEKALKTHSDTERHGIAEKIEAHKEEVDLEFIRTETVKACDRALEGVGRVASIVLAMKNFSHPGEEKPKAVDINNAIENTLTITRNEWKYAAEMETSLDPSLPPVQCLPGGINQVLLNVIVNAAHAIDEYKQDAKPGTISITTQFEPPFAKIVITDTGCGIAKENINKIFDPFFTTKEVGKGTGQGLAIVHDIIVDKHGGTIDIESEAGHGTTFVIRLPMETALPIQC